MPSLFKARRSRFCFASAMSDVKVLTRSAGLNPGKTVGNRIRACKGPFWDA